MHDYFATLFDGSLADQARSESVHLAFLAIAGLCSLATAVISYLLRRDIKRSDEATAKLEKTVDDLSRRHGYEISDIKIAVAPLFTKAGLEQPDYPSR